MTYDARPELQMWLNADDQELVIWSGAGPILRGALGEIATRAQLQPDGELLRFTWQPAPDPESEEPNPRQFARIVIEMLHPEIPETDRGACSGPHICPTSRGRMRYCRESCSACSGVEVRPCAPPNHHY